MGHESAGVSADQHLQALLDDLRDDGQTESSGYFTLEPQRARQLLRQSQKAQPLGYVLNLVACAVLDGASRIDFTLDNDEVSARWQGNGFEADDLKDLERWLLAPQRPEYLKARELALAMTCALLRDPQEVWFATAGFRLNAEFELEPGPEEGCHFYRRSAVGAEVAHRFLSGLVSDYPEHRLLLGRCRFSPLPIFINGRPLPRDLLVEREFFRHYQSGSRLAFCHRDDETPRQVHWVLNGVAFTEPARGISQAAATLVVAVSDLSKDLSQVGLVHDGVYQERKNELRQQVREAACRAVKVCPQQLTKVDGRALALTAADEFRCRGRLEAVDAALAQIEEDRLRHFAFEHPAVRRTAFEREQVARLARGDFAQAWRLVASAKLLAGAQAELSAQRTGSPLWLEALSRRCLALFELGRAEEAGAVVKALLRHSEKRYPEPHPCLGAAWALRAALQSAAREPAAGDSFVRAEERLGLPPDNLQRLALRACRLQPAESVGELLADFEEFWGCEHPALAPLWARHGDYDRARSLAAAGTAQPWLVDPCFGLVVSYGDWFERTRVGAPEVTHFHRWSNLEAQRQARRLLKQREPELAAAILATRVEMSDQNSQWVCRVQGPRTVTRLVVLEPGGQEQQLDIDLSAALWRFSAGVDAKLRVDFADGFSWVAEPSEGS